MATLDELPLSNRLFLKAYPWRRIDPVPWTPLRRPLAESRVALVTSAGFVLPGQEPFDDGIRGGDTSFREIPNEADVATLIETHRSQSFDHTGIRSDPNLAFPLDRFRELVAGGRIGALNHRHISFMGSITAPGRLLRDSAPEVARRLAADGVEAVLLVPV
ncbi:MAG TPA: glycine/sarcosine/betaine reductase selenoprotein B family protein [Thermoanaerobaculia bacterium]|nr:glycine/sarcosine/betaine reductase selenoprotein B family protein [Thermoanaerobaculia bacterium]